MKKFIVLPIILVALFMSISCSAQTEKDPGSTQVAQSGDPEVYYFHHTRRCVTCQAVETVSEESVKELFGDRVSFMEYNLDEDKGKEKAKELGINGQSLLIVNGDKIINITNEGFMYARSNPDKLKQIISDNITPLL
jgi:thiol-disulfide isomerase/thioredoxin